MPCKITKNILFSSHQITLCNNQNYTINKPCGEPGGISGRIDKFLCITLDLNLLPQSHRIFTFSCKSLVAGPRPNAYPPNH